MTSQNGLTLHVFEAELAHVETAEAGILFGVRRVVPGIQLVAAEHNALYHVAALRDLSLQPEFFLQGPMKGGRNTGQTGGNNDTEIEGKTLKPTTEDS